MPFEPKNHSICARLALFALVLLELSLAALNSFNIWSATVIKGRIPDKKNAHMCLILASDLPDQMGLVAGPGFVAAIASTLAAGFGLILVISRRCAGSEIYRLCTAFLCSAC